jgi:DNA-binding winged helix-turn-helix (wHTH) protein
VSYLFGNYLLDLDRRELQDGSKLIAIGPQVFDLLVYLVQNRDRVVSKGDLLKAVWGGRVVSESTLTSHINAVRKAIGDTGDKQALIRTVPRKGFRFVGEIRSGSVGAASPTVSEPKQPLALPDKPSIAVLPFKTSAAIPSRNISPTG